MVTPTSENVSPDFSNLVFVSHASISQSDGDMNDEKKDAKANLSEKTKERKKETYKKCERKTKFKSNAESVDVEEEKGKATIDFNVDLVSQGEEEQRRKQEGKDSEKEWDVGTTLS